MWVVPAARGVMHDRHPYPLDPLLASRLLRCMRGALDNEPVASGTEDAR